MRTQLNTANEKNHHKFKCRQADDTTVLQKSTNTSINYLICLYITFFITYFAVPSYHFFIKQIYFTFLNK